MTGFTDLKTENKKVRYVQALLKLIFREEKSGGVHPQPIYEGYRFSDLRAKLNWCKPHGLAMDYG